MGELREKRLERYKKRLEMYYEAEEAVLLNQEYTIGTKSLKRADLSTIRAAIKDLEKQVESLRKVKNLFEVSEQKLINFSISLAVASL